MSTPKISIIILNWNNWEDTIECLESVFGITYPEYTVVVVDNGSEDDSIEKIKAYCNGKIRVDSPFFAYNLHNKPIPLTEYTRKEAETMNSECSTRLLLIKNEKNYGFSEGNNIGMQMRLNHADYILLLNNDTVVAPDFLDKLVDVAERDATIGIVGPKIYYYEYDGKKDVIWFAGGNINWYTLNAYNIGRKKRDNKTYNQTKRTDYITGCALLVKTAVLTRIGFLDPVYELFFEDADLCVRCTHDHWKVVYVPQSVVWHKVAKSTSKMLPPLYYFARNPLVFAKKYFNRYQFARVLPFFLTGWLIRTGVALIKYRDFALVLSSLHGLYKGLTWRK